LNCAGISRLNDLLSPETADHVYHYASSLLREPNYSVKNLLRKMKVEVVCTTDDPADTLEHHQALAKSNFEIKIFPAFRPDKAMAVKTRKATTHTLPSWKLLLTGRLPISVIYWKPWKKGTCFSIKWGAAFLTMDWKPCTVNHTQNMK
jgi:hypothetical protein